MMETARAKKLCLVGSALVNSFFFSGIVFGWAPLQVMLADEGQYAELCADGPPCPEQQSKFAAIFATATFLVNGISLPSGLFLDHFGGRAMSAGAMIFNFAGLCLVGISDSASLDLFQLGYGLIAVGGQMTLFAVFPTAFEVAKYQTLVFAANSCLFDGSCIVFQVLSSLHEFHPALTRRSLFFGYALFSLPLYLLNISLWRFSGAIGEESPIESRETVDISSSPLLPIPETPVDQEKGDSKISSENTPLLSTAKSAPKKTSQLGLFEQLLTWDFAFILLFASTGILRANLYIGTNEQFLENLGDNDAPNDRLYSKLFGYLLPMGFIFIPVIDFAVGISMKAALQATNALAVAVAALTLIPSLPVQVVTFLVFAGYRAFLYGVMGAFIGETFGPLTLGRITGCVFTTGSLLNLVQVHVGRAWFEYAVARLLETYAAGLREAWEARSCTAQGDFPEYGFEHDSKAKGALRMGTLIFYSLLVCLLACLLARSLAYTHPPGRPPLFVRV
mmetsp:Transcript_32750/g.73923  ORF Transcript_32750/g.73923 Transcript_32750/m.73923 type:complete len:506 (+) Transcript_32750:164-1681(+)